MTTEKDLLVKCSLQTGMHIHMPTRHVSPTYCEWLEEQLIKELKEKEEINEMFLGD